MNSLELTLIFSPVEIDHKKMIDFIRDIDEYSFMYLGSMHQQYELDEVAIRKFLRFKFEQMISANYQVVIK